MRLEQDVSRKGSAAAADIVDVLRQVKLLDDAGKLSKSIRIKFFRNYTVEFIEPFLKYYFGQLGLRCEISFGGYDTVHQDVLASEYLNDYDLVVLSLTHEGLNADWASPTVATAELVERVTGMADLILGRTAAPLILNGFIRPLLDEGGAGHAVRESSASRRVAEMNDLLRRYAEEKAPRCLLVDWERIVMLVGLDEAIDRRMAYLAAAPFRSAFMRFYAHEIFRIGRALKGHAKKCLILDCDNTLWGGIVGEAGLDGIQLDRHSYPGKVFFDFQKAVVQLADEGVMVALCSKNNPDDVMAVLDRHPDCLLKRDHLVGYRINWEAKEANITALVEELNIGMDAVVFVDDSAVECARVQAFLPDITVLEVPKRLSDLPLLVGREGFFDKLVVTAEDLKRSAMYREESRRRESVATYASADEFLAALDLKAVIKRVGQGQVSRVSQLTQKTNQFNLTTRRYSEGEILGMLDDDDCAVFALSAADRFGDLGLTGVLIARRDGDVAVVDTLLMSCRALGRRLEAEFVMNCIEQLQQCWQPRAWVAEYVRTQKNGQVADFWPAFGFVETERRNTATLYRAARGALKLDHVPYIQVNAA
jgi:FkbH-like protein